MGERLFHVRALVSYSTVGRREHIARFGWLCYIVTMPHNLHSIETAARGKNTEEWELLLAR